MVKILYHAFYSQKAHDQFGSIIYDGKQCTAIFISKERGLELYKWDDTVYVGLVDSEKYGGRIESEISRQRKRFEILEKNRDLS